MPWPPAAIAAFVSLAAGMPCQSIALLYASIEVRCFRSLVLGVHQAIANATLMLTRSERTSVIRQSISCDVCGSQRRESNHWFIAYEESGELRISNWTSQRLLSPGTKHICGELCTHKLMSDFLARAAAGAREAARSLDYGRLSNSAHSSESSSQRRLGKVITLPRYAMTSSHGPADDQHRGTGRRTSC